MASRDRTSRRSAHTEPVVGDELYEVPPGEFVAARTALVRALKSDGERETADEIAARRRPTRGAWGLNQVARHDPSLVDAYFDAVSALRDATEHALGGDASGVRPAQLDERATVDAIIASATGQLERAGENVSAALVQQMTDTLRTAGQDDAAAATLRAGRLVGDLSPTTLGLDGFGFAAPGGRASRPAPPASGGVDRERSRRAELEQVADEAEKRARQIAADAARARADADQAEDFARRARQAAEAADRRADAAQRKADEARKRADAKRSPPR